jgi:hypothetical protein
MSTLAELWDEPAAKPKAAASSDVAPKRNPLSTYKPGTPFGEPELPKTGTTMADLWDSTPASTSTTSVSKAGEKTGGEKGVVASALEAAFKARNMFRGAVAEPVATVLSGAQAGVVGPLTGLVAAGRSGQYGTQEGVKAAQEQAKNYAEQTTYQPKTETGKAVVGAIGQAAEKLAGAGPLPELYAFAPLAEGAARQAVTGAKALNAELPRVRIEPVAKAVEPDMAKAATAGSVGSAKVEFNPYAGQITGEEAARGQFPQIKLSKMTQDAAPTEQSTRAQISQEILREGGIDTDQIRQGVITGNENTLRNEHAKAKMANPTPEGELYKQQIANEQTALSNYAQQRIENTGASPTLVTPYERGERINSTFTGDDGLAGFFKTEKKAFYDEATNRTGDNPIQSSNVENLLGNKQFKAGLGLKGNEGVAKSAEELINLAKTVGFEDEFGKVHGPNTVGAWTAVQKSLNEGWTPQNAAIIRKINQAIERDIGAAGGLDLLKKADQLHQAEKVLFGSKGIKQIFGDIDPNGVQTATAFEAIPQKLNSMPVDQWKHIYETAEKVAKGTIDGPIDKATGMPKWSIQVPEELRVSAQSAMNEMKGNIAREIYQAGAAKAGEWNQNAVNKILNARADKIKLAFSPEEQKSFHTLNVGGYLMPGVHGYEGGGQQLRRVGLIEGNLGKAGAGAGAAAGTALLGPGVGTAVGGYLGGKAGVAGSEALAARALQKQAQQSKAEMQNAAKLGSKLSDIGKGK